MLEKIELQQMVVARIQTCGENDTFLRIITCKHAFQVSLMKVHAQCAFGSSQAYFHQINVESSSSL